MINNNELRIGNWVLDGNDYRIVTKVMHVSCKTFLGTKKRKMARNGAF